MELLQLRYFYESAKNESFAKTSEKYMVPTTSVSASVRRLEKEMGCALFDRTANRIVLNEKGRQLMQTLHTVFAELDNTVEKLSDSGEDTGEIKMLVRAVRSQVTTHIIEYRKQNPGVLFKTVFDFMASNFEDYDIIIDEKTDKYEGYEHFELFNIRMRLRVAADSVLCGRELTLKELKNEPFVSMGTETNMHKILIRACRRAGFTPNIVIQANDASCYARFIKAGAGIGIVKEMETADRGVKFLTVTDFDEKQIVHAYYKQAHGTVKDFLDFLKTKTL